MYRIVPAEKENTHISLMGKSPVKSLAGSTVCAFGGGEGVCGVCVCVCVCVCACGRTILRWIFKIYGVNLENRQVFVT